jgi:hypothetical protein
MGFKRWRPALCCRRGVIDAANTVGPGWSAGQNQFIEHLASVAHDDVSLRPLGFELEPTWAGKEKRAVHHHAQLVVGGVGRGCQGQAWGDRSNTKIRLFIASSFIAPWWRPKKRVVDSGPKFTLPTLA